MRFSNLFFPLVFAGLSLGRADSVNGQEDRRTAGTPPPPDSCEVNFTERIEEPLILLENRIYEIQAGDLTSPFLGNTVYRVRGIVTAIAPIVNTFWMQDLEGDGDNSTSDGIAVTSNTGPQGIFLGSPVDLAIGDIVVLEAASVFEIQVDDMNDNLRQPRTSLGPSDLNDVTIESRGNDIPEPVIIGAEGRLPPSENMQAGVYFWESLKGMVVTVKTPLAVSPRVANFLYTVTDNGEFVTGLSERGALNVGPGDFNPETILIVELDEYFNFSLPNSSTGATFDDVEGVVLDLTSGEYAIVPTKVFGLVEDGGLDKSSTTCGGGIGSSTLSVGTYHLNSLLDYDEVASNIVNNMGYPDVLALQGTIDAGLDLSLLVEAVEDIPSILPQTYTIIPSLRDGTPILYNPRTIRQYSQRVSMKDLAGRPVPPHLAAKLEFLDTRERFDIINLRLTDKDGSAAKFGVNQPFENLQEADEINAGVDERLAETNFVRTSLINNFVTDPAKLIVLGAMYENEFVSPMVNLDGAGLKNLVRDIAPNEGYSTINLDTGNAEAWDHIFVGLDYCQNSIGEYIHVNTEFYEGLEYDPMVACITFPNLVRK